MQVSTGPLSRTAKKWIGGVVDHLLCTCGPCRQFPRSLLGPLACTAISLRNTFVFAVYPHAFIPTCAAGAAARRLRVPSVDCTSPSSENGGDGGGEYVEQRGGKESGRLSGLLFLAVLDLVCLPTFSFNPCVSIVA
jgi:hypothetical protein